jgi:hypothetical protein
VRICVSEPVIQALRATGKVNGPLFTITNGMDFAELPPRKSWESRDFDLLIVGIKQPALAIEIHGHLKASNLRVAVLTQPLLRSAFLELLGNARIALFLPHATEGFYLPALEGFALETLVVCPDCIGNRLFCLPETTCLQPDYTVEALFQAINHALRLSLPERLALLDARPAHGGPAHSGVRTAGVPQPAASNRRDLVEPLSPRQTQTQRHVKCHQRRSPDTAERNPGFARFPPTPRIPA